MALVVNSNSQSLQSGLLIVVVDGSGSADILLELHNVPRPLSVGIEDNHLVGDVTSGQQQGRRKESTLCETRGGRSRARQ